jgi:hypothetical protein
LPGQNCRRAVSDAELTLAGIFPWGVAWRGSDDDERRLDAAAVAMAPKRAARPSGANRADLRWFRFANREGEAPDAQFDALLVLEIPISEVTNDDEPTAARTARVMGRLAQQISRLVFLRTQ